MICPYPGCGGEVKITTIVGHCEKCAQPVFLCPECQTMNRSFSRYCRNCKQYISFPNLRTPESWQEAAITQSRKLSLAELWETQLQPGRIYAPLVASYGYLTVCSLDGSWALLKQSNGEITLTAALPNSEPIAYCPVIADSRLYIAASGGIYAVDLLPLANSNKDHNKLNGKVIWRTGTPGKGEEITSHLMYCRGELVFITRYESNSKLLLLDCESRKAREVAIDGSTCNPVLINGTVIVLSEIGVLHSIDIESGDLINQKRFNVPIDIDVAPTTLGARVFFISKAKELYSFDCNNARSLRRLCTFPESKVYNMVASPNGILLATAYGLRHFDFSGVLTFRAGESEQDSVYTSPIATSDSFLVATAKGEVRVYDGTSEFPEDIHIVAIGHAIWSPPALVNGMIFVASESGIVKAFLCNG